MSQAEIHYYVPKKSRELDDTEKILNAMGDFMATFPVPEERKFNPVPEEAPGEAVFIRLTQNLAGPKPQYELLEQAEAIRKGVESHFKDEDRARLSSHFAGIAISGALESE